MFQCDRFHEKMNGVIERSGQILHLSFTQEAVSD